MSWFRLLASLAVVFAPAVCAEVRLLKFAGAPEFRMGSVTSKRFVSPDMGARRLTLNFSLSQPGNEFAQHTHDDCDDTILMFEGIAELRQGDKRTSFKPGQAVFVPGGQIHGTITGNVVSTMISFQTPPDKALYSGARDSSRPGAAPPKGVITPGAVKYIDFGGKHGFFVHPGMGARRVAVAQWKMRPGEKIAATVPKDGEQVLFVWKGSISVTSKSGSLKVLSKDAVFTSGPETFEFRNDSAGEAIVIQAQAPPVAGWEKTR